MARVKRTAKTTKKGCFSKKKDPCWDGYEALGMKKKGGRTVPNCVPRQRSPKKP